MIITICVFQHCILHVLYLVNMFLAFVALRWQDILEAFRFHMAYIPKLKIYYLFVSTFTHKFISSTLISFRMKSCHRFTNLNFMRFIFRMVNCLSLEWNLSSFILHRWIWHLFNFFRTEFHLICCSAIKFRFISIINISTSCWSLWINL